MGCNSLVALVGKLMQDHGSHHLPVTEPRGGYIGMPSIHDFLEILGFGGVGQSVATIITLEPAENLTALSIGKLQLD